MFKKTESPNSIEHIITLGNHYHGYVKLHPLLREYLNNNIENFTNFLNKKTNGDYLMESELYRGFIICK